MKFLLFTFLILGVHGLHAAVDLEGKQPEDFNWDQYVGGGGSTSDEMTRAQEGAKILGQRMDALCLKYRKLLESRSEKEALRVFDEMQEYWKKASDAQIALIGSSREGGSGAKVAYPKARLYSYLFRVKELNNLAGQCLFLNE